MLTYQDFMAKENTEEFLLRAINEHLSSKIYREAVIANDYDKQHNTTIINFQKLLYTMSGTAVPDNFSANYKLCSNFFNRFITQENQFLLGNGINWTDPKTGEKLGKDFDTRMQELGHEALVAGVAFGFWNYDHLEVFNIREFVPLYDEENGALMAGIRFWQIDSNKPLRITLFELDGYTNYIRKNGKVELLTDKRSYKELTRTTEADGTEIYDGENYPTFPVVPLFANIHKQSELIGLREQIDAYDLIKSGFANDLDDASQIYWIIQNGSGMDDVDLAKFRERLKVVKAAVVEEDGARAESHTMDVPYAAREALLSRLRSDLYDDFMALDTKDIVGGATTATQIEAAYEPLNNKADQYEFCVIDFLQGIMTVAGIEDNPSFTRSYIVNRQETIQSLISSAQFLEPTYIMQKILEVLGDGDKYEEMLEQVQANELGALNANAEEEAESEQ